MKKVYLKNHWLSFSPLLLSAIISVLIVLTSKSLPQKLPLFYSLSWGDKQLANHQQLFIIPAIIALVTLFNLVLSWQLHHQQIFLKKILQISNLLVSLILVITFLKIVFIFI